MSQRRISGFSKKSQQEKTAWLVTQYLSEFPEAKSLFDTYRHPDLKRQQRHDDFIENALTNYYLPYAVAPNFNINGTLYALPMAIEESSVIAAASNAAKFWLDRGGFKAEVLGTEKNGQVHFNYFGKKSVLTSFFAEIKSELIASIAALEKNMKSRGGGLIDISCIDKTEALEGYYQLHLRFETKDAMGANFINSCLEQVATTFEAKAATYAPFISNDSFPEVVMSILSNFVPECRVKASVSCPLESLTFGDMDGQIFAEKFVRAIAIAHADPRRAVTHNKGIMNGIDAVVLATGNDFRAVEAGVHAYASCDGKYQSLTHARIENDQFHFWMEIPLALGTVGGLTSLHPLANLSMQILQQPDAETLMQIVAVAGLAQNFAAVKSLVTTGIQKGHMKMHLMNILSQLEASPDEKKETITYFDDKVISHSAVTSYVKSLRKKASS